MKIEQTKKQQDDYFFLQGLKQIQTDAMDTQNQMDEETRQATLEFIKSHLRKIHCTDGEVSDPIVCTMLLPNAGIATMVAYRMSDSRQPDFWVAVQRQDDIHNL